MAFIQRALVLGTGLLATVATQSASAVVVDFENPPYTATSVYGQDGWVFNGSYIPQGNNGSFDVSTSAPLAGSQSALYTQTTTGSIGSDASKANVITVVSDGTSATDLIATVLIQANNNAMGNGQVGIFFGSDTAAGTTQINTLLNDVNSGAGTGLLQVASGAGPFTTFDDTYRGEVLELTYNVDFDNQEYTLFQRDFPSGTSSQVGAGVFNFSGSFAPDTPGGLSYTVGVGTLLRAGTGRIDNITLAPIPEPTTLGLAMLGLGGLVLRRRGRSPSR